MNSKGTLLFIALLSVSFASLIQVPQVLAASGSNYEVLSGKHSVTGAQNALIVLVEFLDVQHAMSSEQVKKAAVDELNSYYNEASYGKVSITGSVYGWYRVEHSIGYYGDDSEEPGDDDNLYQLARDAVTLLPSSIDLTSFRFLVVVHAGPDQAQDQSSVRSDEIWSQCYCSVFPTYRSESIYVRGKSFENYAFLSEFNGVGTFAHEWGHLLGLPDLYDTKTKNSYVGYWSLMDHGNRCCPNDHQDTPSHIGAWGSALLGWLTPTVVDASVLVSAYDLKPLEWTQPTSLLIPVSPSTYYFIEYRTKSGTDVHLPNSGVLVYFVNELLKSGNGIVRLVNPLTGELFPAQERVASLNGAVFKASDDFRDMKHHVYLAFVEETDFITTIYSPQELGAYFIKTQLRTSITATSGMYADQISTSGILLDQTGMPMPGQSVEIDILDRSTGQWRKIGTSTTDQLGEVNFQLDLTYPVGDYLFRLLYPGGKGGAVWYTSSNVQFSAEVTPARMVLSVVVSSFVVDEASIIISARSLRGEPLVGVTVTVYVDNVREAVATTDENGKASLILHFSLGDLGFRRISAVTQKENYESAQSFDTTFVLSLWLIVGISATVTVVCVAVWNRRRKLPD